MRLAGVSGDIGCCNGLSDGLAQTLQAPPQPTSVNDDRHQGHIAVNPAQSPDPNPHKNRQRRLEPQGFRRFFLLF